MKSERMVLNATKRTVFGRKVKKLRSEGKIPASVFGASTQSISLTLERVAFQKLFRKAGETTLVDLYIEGEKQPRPVLITHVQTHPVKDTLVHVDLHQVDLTKAVTAPIPVTLIGESAAVKDKAAILVTVLSEIEVEALPTDLPDRIEVDISKLVEFGDSIHVKDLSVDRKKVKVLIGEDETVITVQEPKEEIEEVPPPAGGPAEGEAEVAPVVEGEAAGEGEKEGEGKSKAKAEQPTGKLEKSKDEKTKDKKQQ